MNRTTLSIILLISVWVWIFIIWYHLVVAYLVVSTILTIVILIPTNKPKQSQKTTVKTLWRKEHRA